MLKYLNMCTHPRWYGCCCPFPFTKTHTVECMCALNNDVYIDGNNDDGSPSETLPLTTSNETYLFKKHWWTLEQWCLEDDHLPPAVISNNISERNCEQLFVGCVCVVRMDDSEIELAVVWWQRMVALKSIDAWEECDASYPLFICAEGLCIRKSRNF